MLRHHTKLLALLLALTMLFAACTPAPTTAEPPAPREQVKFSELTYTRPDIAKLGSMIDQALADTAAGGKQAEVLAQYDQILDEVVNYDTMQSLARLHNDMDLSDELYDTEVVLLDQEYSKLDNRLLELTGAILDSGYADAAKKAWGDDYVARYETYKKLNSKEIEPLTDREAELLNEYKKLAAQDYTTTYNGKEVAVGDLDFNDPKAAIPYYEIYARRNKELGEIYRELVQLRTQIAQTLGFDNYADYAYALLSRDYTKEEAAAFAAKVVDQLVPLQDPFRMLYGQDISQAMSTMTVDFTDGIPALEAALQQEYPAQMREALTFMQNNEMYHYSDAPNTSHGAYSTIIGGYRAPFMFVNTADYTDPGTVFHEFGHYYNFYKMDVPRWNDSNSLDTAEIHSQGLEVLMYKSYPELYGDDAELITYSNLNGLLSSVIQGCAEDEFQQQVYANPEMTLDEMNEAHAEITQKYLGYPLLYEWVDIHHHYETPMYYISYATSAISALEIWEISTQNRSKAIGIYDKITQYTLNAPYRNSLRESGLSDPFTSNAVADIAKTLRTQLSLDRASHLAA